MSVFCLRSLYNLLLWVDKENPVNKSLLLLSQWAKSPKEISLKECVFVNSVLKIQ